MVKLIFNKAPVVVANAPTTAEALQLSWFYSFIFSSDYKQWALHSIPMPLNKLLFYCVDVSVASAVDLATLITEICWIVFFHRYTVSKSLSMLYIHVFDLIVFIKICN